MIVTATCARGHKWTAQKIARPETQPNGPPRIIRVIDPKKCPKCEGEYVSTYEDRRMT